MAPFAPIGCRDEAMRGFRAFPIIVAGLMAVAHAGQASAALVGQSVSTGIAALKEWNVVSFNNFTSYNVAANGLVLNNATAAANSTAPPAISFKAFIYVFSVKDPGAAPPAPGTSSPMCIGGIVRGLIYGDKGVYISLFSYYCASPPASP